MTSRTIVAADLPALKLWAEGKNKIIHEVDAQMRAFLDSERVIKNQRTILDNFEKRCTPEGNFKIRGKKMQQKLRAHHQAKLRESIALQTRETPMPSEEDVQAAEDLKILLAKLSRWQRAHLMQWPQCETPEQLGEWEREMAESLLPVVSLKKPRCLSKIFPTREERDDYWNEIKRIQFEMAFSEDQLIAVQNYRDSNKKANALFDVQNYIVKNGTRQRTDPLAHLVRMNCQAGNPYQTMERKNKLKVQDLTVFRGIEAMLLQGNLGEEMFEQNAGPEMVFFGVINHGYVNFIVLVDNRNMKKKSIKRICTWCKKAKSDTHNHNCSYMSNAGLPAADLTIETPRDIMDICPKKTEFSNQWHGAISDGRVLFKNLSESEYSQYEEEEEGEQEQQVLGLIESDLDNENKQSNLIRNVTSIANQEVLQHIVAIDDNGQQIDYKNILVDEKPKVLKFDPLPDERLSLKNQNEILRKRVRDAELWMKVMEGKAFADWRRNQALVYALNQVTADLKFNQNALIDASDNIKLLIDKIPAAPVPVQHLISHAPEFPIKNEPLPEQSIWAEGEPEDLAQAVFGAEDPKNLEQKLSYSMGGAEEEGEASFGEKMSSNFEQYMKNRLDNISKTNRLWDLEGQEMPSNLYSDVHSLGNVSSELQMINFSSNENSVKKNKKRQHEQRRPLQDEEEEEEENEMTLVKPLKKQRKN